MMPPIILTVLQGLFLLLLYVFVARAVRAVIKDVTPVAGRQRKSQPPKPARQPNPPKPAPQAATGQGDSGDGKPERVAPREIVVHKPEGAPKVLPLNGGEILFGRGGQATVPLTDPYISDRHARIHYDGRRWLVSDLGSTNGTFLNQVKVTEPTPIAAGDQLGIGRTVVEVRK